MIQWVVGFVGARYLAMAALVAVPLLALSAYTNVTQWADYRAATKQADAACTAKMNQVALDAVAAWQAEQADKQAEIDVQAQADQATTTATLESIVGRTERAANMIRQAAARTHETDPVAAVGCARIPAEWVRPVNDALSAPRTR
ncbi:MAG: hypothetical protein KAX77_01285 [Xanthomonadales bacterium]|nr:hypothetical protein [Xanthomonadales bacterium]